MSAVYNFSCHGINLLYEKDLKSMVLTTRGAKCPNIKIFSTLCYDTSSHRRLKYKKEYPPYTIYTCIYLYVCIYSIRWVFFFVCDSVYNFFFIFNISSACASSCHTYLTSRLSGIPGMRVGYVHQFPFIRSPC